jgi:hypothetical protein
MTCEGTESDQKGITNAIHGRPDKLDWDWIGKRSFVYRILRMERKGGSRLQVTC